MAANVETMFSVREKPWHGLGTIVMEALEEQKQIEQEVKLFMQDNEYASSERFRVSWKNVDSTKLDTKRIKEEMPEIYADYGKVSHCRKFVVKVA